MKKLFSIRTSDAAFSFATLLLRVGAGSLMLVAHGFDKLMHFSGKSTTFADPFGIGHPTSMALVVFAEFLCSLCHPWVIYPPRLHSVDNCDVGGPFSAHKGDFFGDGKNAGLYLICFTALLFLGPGKASLDRFIGK